MPWNVATHQASTYLSLSLSSPRLLPFIRAISFCLWLRLRRDTSAVGIADAEHFALFVVSPRLFRITYLSFSCYSFSCYFMEPWRPWRVYVASMKITFAKVIELNDSLKFRPSKVNASDGLVTFYLEACKRHAWRVNKCSHLREYVAQAGQIK